MKLLALLLVFLIAPSGVKAQESGTQKIIKKGEILSLTKSIEIGLKYHPNILAANSVVRANESRVGEAKANYFPQIGLSSGYVRGSSTPSSSSAGPSGNLNTATLSQTIYDFGRTSTEVKIQRINLNSSHSDLANLSDQIVFGIKQTYFGVLQAERNVNVAVETVKEFQQHLDQAQAFYKAGTVPRIDVTKAEVDLSNAKLNLISAENTFKVSRVQLNNAMGVPDAPEYGIEDNLSFQKYPVTLKAATERAYENRSDLKSLETRKEAARESVALAKKGFYPSFSGNANYNHGGAGFPLEESWSAGVFVNFSLFSGYLTTYQVEEAGANLNTLKADEEALRQNILLDVQSSYLNLQEAGERVPTAEITKKQAQENLDLANGRYSAGVGSPLEVTDAEVAFSNAKTSYIRALYDYKVAQASLERAMGIR
jgi:outer membrane protein